MRSCNAGKMPQRCAVKRGTLCSSQRDFTALYAFAIRTSGGRGLSSTLLFSPPLANDTLPHWYRTQGSRESENRRAELQPSGHASARDHQVRPGQRGGGYGEMGKWSMRSCDLAHFLLSASALRSRVPMRTRARVICSSLLLASNVRQSTSRT